MVVQTLYAGCITLSEREMVVLRSHSALDVLELDLGPLDIPAGLHRLVDHTEQEQ